MTLDILHEPIPRTRYALMHVTLINGNASSWPYWARKLLGYYTIRSELARNTHRCTSNRWKMETLEGERPAAVLKKPTKFYVSLGDPDRL